MLEPRGIIPAMITPFDRDGELNEQALRVQTRRLIEAGVHGLFCLGTNGEFFTLSFEEKERIVDIVVEEAGGKVPVYAGAGDISTRETIRLAKRFEQIGADAVSVITPYFLAFSQHELKAHYLQLAESIEVPIILYNIPARTGNQLQPQTVSELTEIPNIAGIKDSSGSYDTILQYLEASKKRLKVLSGTDSLILSTLMAGGAGGIASTANVFPKLTVAIYERWQAGDIVGAEEAQRKLRWLRDSFSSARCLPS